MLGSANVDECLRGYLTKYDCSSADINPIGGISKKDLSRFLRFAKDEYNLGVLESFLEATPTAELEPIGKEYVQSDEQDMGCTYEELGLFGRLRKIEKLGPFSMWQKLCAIWPDKTPRQCHERTRFLWHYFGINVSNVAPIHSVGIMLGCKTFAGVSALAIPQTCSIMLTRRSCSVINKKSSHRLCMRRHIRQTRIVTISCPS